ncbi:hypothetical protein DM860_002284 [Cuscuta australis]|uniref:Uncharacterized protein n=1 Tax=Cuscuta australis TaxID=267555 RepID=A0A328CYL9_9ASTE|nr:hypothetical protein DM860_002284 [Cuscuta australis]
MKIRNEQRLCPSSPELFGPKYKIRAGEFQVFSIRRHPRISIVFSGRPSGVTVWYASVKSISFSFNPLVLGFRAMEIVMERRVVQCHLTRCTAAVAAAASDRISQVPIEILEHIS